MPCLVRERSLELDAEVRLRFGSFSGTVGGEVDSEVVEGVVG